jgi:hypothetical protein
VSRGNQLHSRIYTHTQAAYDSADAALRSYHVGFFRALQSTAPCSTRATPPGILYPALQELSDSPSCQVVHGMVVGDCVIVEYACFADPDCRQCLAALIAAAANHGSNGTKADAFRSPECAATSPALISDLSVNCGGRIFPTCTFNKQQCIFFPECRACLNTLGDGDGAEAARQCPGSTQVSSRALDKMLRPTASTATPRRATFGVSDAPTTSTAALV